MSDVADTERMAALVLECGTASMEMAAFMIREGGEMQRLMTAATAHTHRAAAAKADLEAFISAHPDVPVPPMPPGPRQKAALSLIPLATKN